MKKSILLISLVSVSIITQSFYTAPENTIQSSAEALVLMQQNCFTCHSPNADLDTRVAPPMIEIKKHYLEKFNTKNDFTNAFLKYMNHPSIETSQMPEAITKFGLMPKMSFPDAQIQSIANYIYDNDLQHPKWFEKHYQDAHNDTSYLSIGKQYAMNTKAVLGKNLLGAMQKNGIVNALEFCNIKATPLTDSMSKILHTNIKRVSDKPRNPLNTANATELEIIELFKQTIAKGEKPQPIVKETTEQATAYVAIETNGMCMKCHGEIGTDLSETLHQKIQTLYPNDKATGYKSGEIRGLFVVTMNKKK